MAVKRSLFERVRGYRAKARSQAFVEFAFVLPIMLTLMCGVFDYGFMLGNSMVLATAAREGANAGARQLTDPITKGLQIAVSNAMPRVKLDSTNGGVIITQVMYKPAVSPSKFVLANGLGSCLCVGGLYGNSNTLLNHSTILDKSVATNNSWMVETRVLPMTNTVLDPMNQVMTVAEVFYTNQFVTPIGTLIGMVTPPILYDIAFF